MDVAGGLDDQGSRSCNVRDEMIGDIRASRRVDVYTGIDGRGLGRPRAFYSFRDPLL